MAGFLGCRHARSVHRGPWVPVIWLVILWRRLSDLIWCALSPLDQDDFQDMVDAAHDHPNIWSDASMEAIPHLNVEVAGAGGITHAPPEMFGDNGWGHAQDLEVAPIFVRRADGARGRIVESHICPSGILWCLSRDG